MWALIQLQLLTGARPGELLGLRPVDLQMEGDSWFAEPQQHKTSFRGITRRIYFGPRAQTVIAPFLRERPVDRALFSPREAEEQRRAKAHQKRRTPLSCGNVPGSHRVAKPKRAPEQVYTVASYRRCIERACAQAFALPEELRQRRVEGKKGQRWESVAQWKNRLGPEKYALVRQWQKQHRFHPHQLRHNAATRLRQQYGIDLARTVLGHRSMMTTAIYAEADFAKARQAIRETG